MSATAVPASIAQTANTGSVHPCLRCGACCASFRVAFYWAEAAPHTPEGIPEHLTRKLDPLRVAMDGTDQPQPRCVALRGSIGIDAHCGEYARRPSPCHALKPAWEDGQPSPQCDRARQRHGLPALELQDWASWRLEHSQSNDVAEQTAAPDAPPLPAAQSNSQPGDSGSIELVLDRPMIASMPSAPPASESPGVAAFAGVEVIAEGAQPLQFDLDQLGVEPLAEPTPPLPPEGGVLGPMYEAEQRVDH
jgi:Fe-S-cluster containining protein